MDYIKIRFGEDIENVGSRFERTLEQMFRSVNPTFCLSERNWSPQMDIFETPEEIIIRAEIAGVDKEDLQVEINRRAVQISGSRRELTQTPGGTYRLAEIQYGSFERVLYLPSPIDTEVVSSSCVNGFLQLRLAKLPPAKTHKITIEEE
jgi:HSP20 family protein